MESLVEIDTEAEELERTNQELAELEREIEALQETTILFHNLIGISGGKLKSVAGLTGGALLGIARGVDVLKQIAPSVPTSGIAIAITTALGVAVGGPIGGLVVAPSVAAVLGGALCGGGLGVVSGMYLWAKPS